MALPILSLVLAAGVVASADAQSPGRGGGHGRGGDVARTDRALSLDEAVARAERRYQARAVRAEEKRHGDRIEYRIRLLADDGRVFEVRIDAESGREN